MVADAAWSEEALQTTVQRLAAPSEQQVAWLKELGTYPSLDELALDFDNELRRIRDELPSDHALLRLDRKLEEMSGEDKAALWKPEALETEPWNSVRTFARDALTELGVPNDPGAGAGRLRAG